MYSSTSFASFGHIGGLNLYIETIENLRLHIETKERMKELENTSMISKAMQMLELLAHNTQGMSLQEMVEEMAYPKSSIYKIASNLLDLGYLGRESDSLRYFLSRKMLSVGLSAVSSYNIIEKSRDIMCQLRDKVRESVMIGTLVDNEALLLNQVAGNLDFVFSLQPGMRFKLHSTAPGKVLWAHLPPKERNKILDSIELEAINDHTITDKELLLAELRTIKNLGYAADLNETVEGVHCIAAPIFDETGKVTACVWTSGPAGRLPIDKIEWVAQQVMECGWAISKNIGATNK